jgi:Domain of unknown function (DUF4314)
MTSTATARISRDQPPGRNDRGERQREERLRTAYRAADQERAGKGPDNAALIRENSRKEKNPVTSDKPNRFTMADAQPPVPEVTDVRDTFMRGDRVALERTDDPDTRLRPGDEGTVTRYDPKLGQLDVRWDSGSTLSMLLNDGDRVRLITPASGTGTGETGKETGR